MDDSHHPDYLRQKLGNSKLKVPPYCRMALGVLELSYKKLAFQECERGLGGQGVVDLGLLGLDIGFEGGLDVGS